MNWFDFTVNELFYECINFSERIYLFVYISNRNISGNYLFIIWKDKFNWTYFISLWLRFGNTWYWSKTLEFTVETNVFLQRLNGKLMVNGHIWSLLSKLNLWNGLLRTFWSFYFELLLICLDVPLFLFFNVSVSG